jgi:hypothetical protein
MALRQFLEGYGIDTLGDPDGDRPLPPPLDGWGLSDRDLYQLAREEYLRLAAAGRPFFLQVNTLDTHFPHERIDPAVVGDLPDSLSTAEKIIRGADRQVGAFVRFLAAQDNARDTVIVIVPDHPCSSPPLPRTAGTGNALFLLTNAPPERQPPPPPGGFTHLHMARFLREVAGIRSNHRFFTELLPPALAADLGALCSDRYRPDLIRLNHRLWARPLWWRVPVVIRRREGGGFVVSVRGVAQDVTPAPGQAFAFFPDNSLVDEYAPVRLGTAAELKAALAAAPRQAVLVTEETDGRFAAQVGLADAQGDRYVSEDDNIVFMAAYRYDDDPSPAP